VIGFLKSERGSAPIIGLVLLLPLLAAIIYGVAWYGQMANVQNVVEEAARAGARWLASHPGDIEGAKQRAAEVVMGSFTVKKGIDNPNMTGKLVGRLTKEGGRYFIGSTLVKPVSGSVRQDMEKLLNKTVVADGYWGEADVFKVKTATTDPPEMQTVKQQGGKPDGQAGTSGKQVVNQVRHTGPFPAAALAKYGQGPWGTWWVPPAENSGDQVYEKKNIDFTDEGGSTAYWNPSFSAPSSAMIKEVSFKTAPAYDDYFTTQRVEGYKNGKWYVIRDYYRIHGIHHGYVFDTISVGGKGYTKIRFNFVMYDRARSAYGSPWNSYIRVTYGKPSTGWPDPGAWWIWGQPGAVRCAPNGQEVTLTSPTWWTQNYAKYRLYATADDHFSLKIDNRVVLRGGREMKTWDWEPGTKRSVQLVVNARNNYGPAGFLFSMRQVGWHWPTSYRPQSIAGGLVKYPGWTVPHAQWVTVTAKDRYGRAAPVSILKGSAWVANGSGTLRFYAYPNATYSVYVGSRYHIRPFRPGRPRPGETPRYDVTVSFNGEVVLRSDASWQYTPVDGVRYGSATLPQKVSPDTEFTVRLTATNTGHKEWFAKRPSWWPKTWSNPNSWQTRFSYHWYDNRGNLVVRNGLRTELPRTVRPGETVTLDVKVKTPSRPGRYKLVIDGAQEHCAWFGPLQGVNWPTIEAWIDVADAPYGVSYDPVRVPKYMEAGKTYKLLVTVTNTGTLTWTPESKVGLSYHWYKAAGGRKGSVVTWDDGTRVYVRRSVPPGGKYTFSLPVKAPSNPGSYVLELDMVHEHETWFSQKDCPVVNAPVKVPRGQVLKGILTYDGTDYWVGNTLVRSAGPDLSRFTGRRVILWGDRTGKIRFYWVTSIKEHFPDDQTAVITFDPSKDVLCNDPEKGDPEAPPGDPVKFPRSDGYAYCRVTYHHPVPVRKFWDWTSDRGMWKDAESPSWSITGEAFFKSGERGDKS
jgi:hypothetical protein